MLEVNTKINHLYIWLKVFCVLADSVQTVTHSSDTQSLVVSRSYIYNSHRLPVWPLPTTQTNSMAGVKFPQVWMPSPALLLIQPMNLWSTILDYKRPVGQIIPRSEDLILKIPSNPLLESIKDDLWLIQDLNHLRIHGWKLHLKTRKPVQVMTYSCHFFSKERGCSTEKQPHSTLVHFHMALHCTDHSTMTGYCLAPWM